jgi:hypothetical protein
MFPTGVGMNRLTYRSSYTPKNVPHGRGDEPGSTVKCILVRLMFPTGVGMNRINGFS